MTIRVTVQDGVTVLGTPGQNLLEILASTRSHLDAACAGRGTCGTCRFIPVSGELPPYSEAESAVLSASDHDAGIRLACHIVPVEDMVIRVPRASETEILYGSADLLPLPAVSSAEHAALGVAFDVGTTTVAASLVRLADGLELARDSALNPQTAYGFDVLNRISYAMENPVVHLPELQGSITGCIDEILDRLLASAKRDRADITDIAVAANTTMLHLLVGIDPSSIGVAPYAPVFTGAQHLPAHTVGLSVPAGCRLRCLPSVSGFVGADVLAGAHVAGLAQREGKVLFLDIGTNGEMILATDGRLIACACAAGPAFEGMNISHGIRASVGAIEDVEIRDGEVSLKTIGDAPPVGICGSGILAAVREFLRTGLMGRNGRLRQGGRPPDDSSLDSLLIEEGKTRGVILSAEPRIVVSQADIRNVQLAKGAILSGVTALLRCGGVEAQDIDEVIIAGQFGSHLRVESLREAGLIPGAFRGRVSYLGNTSHSGALAALIDSGVENELSELAERVEYFELSSLDDMEELFIRSLSFDDPKEG